MAVYECHGHIALGKNSIEEKIIMLRDSGVAYFRDAGAKEELYDSIFPKEKIESKILHIKNLAAENDIKFVSPIYAFYKEGLYGKFLGKSFSSTKDLYKKIVEVKKLGADYIKVMYSGIASFTKPGELSCQPLSKEEIKEIVNMCHGEGLAVMAHCNGANTIKYAIEYGTDSIEHGIFIDDEGISMLAQSERKTIWVPTIVAIANDELQSAHSKSVKKAIDLDIVVASGSDCGCSSVGFGAGSKEENAAVLEHKIGQDKLNANNNILKERFQRR